MSRGFHCLLLASFALAAVGCGEQPADEPHAHGANSAKEHKGHVDEHGHEGESGHDEGEAQAGASFMEGRGILLGKEAAQQIGLQTGAVTTRKMTIRIAADAQVYDAAHAHSPANGDSADHNSRAVAFISAHLSGFLKPGQSVGIETGDAPPIQGRLVRLNSETTNVIGRVEAIIEASDPEHRFDFGSFGKVTFNAGEREVVAIPATALVQAVSGTFVYVQNGKRFLRTPVQVGAVSEGWAEITDGLYEGDVVA
ncbi:MAG: efflux RND transporter periplasmic adaptor subunit, partial [Opitutaceae bacterium]